MRRLVLAVILFASGCSGRDPARDAGDSTRSLVRIDLSYTHVGGDARFDAQAHFVRYRSFDPAGVPTLLGFTDFDAIPLDSCRVSDGTAELDEALGAGPALPAEVALLDAGRLQVRGPSDRAILRAHHYPELVSFVSGVVYGADDTQPVALGLGQPYQVVGEGGEEVGAFVASVMAPRSFPSLSLEPLRRGGDLDVRWSDAADGEALRLEIKWSSRLGARAVRCRVRDDGEFTVGREAFDELPAGATATITATRLARGPVDAPGAGHGELTVALRDVAPLPVAP